MAGLPGASLYAAFLVMTRSELPSALAASVAAAMYLAWVSLVLPARMAVYASLTGCSAASMASGDPSMLLYTALAGVQRRL